MSTTGSDANETTAESLHALEAGTADAARRIVASYADDFFDFVTLASMLGVAPNELDYKAVAAEHAEPVKRTRKKSTKKASKKSTKKTTKKTTKKATKKTTKKATKAGAKKTTKKATKKATTKAAE